jgi:hypothetical protein
MELSSMAVPPKIIHVIFGLYMKKTNQLLGYPHGYGKPHMIV